MNAILSKNRYSESSNNKFVHFMKLTVWFALGKSEVYKRMFVEVINVSSGIPSQFKKERLRGEHFVIGNKYIILFDLLYPQKS